jgi:hypothetical protein
MIMTITLMSIKLKSNLYLSMCLLNIPKASFKGSKNMRQMKKCIHTNKYRDCLRYICWIYLKILQSTCAKLLIYKLRLIRNC